MKNWLSYFFIIILTSSLVFGCGRSNNDQGEQPPIGVEQDIGKFSVTRSQKGNPRWKLNAKSAKFMDSGQVKIEDIDLVIFGDKTGQKINVHGNSGEFSRNTYNVRIIGNVEGVLSDGGKLITDELYWSESEKKIYTMPGIKVILIYKDTTITGEELEARTELETVTLKNVSGFTIVKEE